MKEQTEALLVTLQKQVKALDKKQAKIVMNYHRKLLKELWKNKDITKFSIEVGYLPDTEEYFSSSVYYDVTDTFKKRVDEDLKSRKGKKNKEVYKTFKNYIEDNTVMYGAGLNAIPSEFLTEETTNILYALARIWDNFVKFLIANKNCADAEETTKIHYFPNGTFTEEVVEE